MFSLLKGKKVFYLGVLRYIDGYVVVLQGKHFCSKNRPAPFFPAYRNILHGLGSLTSSCDGSPSGPKTPAAAPPPPPPPPPTPPPPPPPSAADEAPLLPLGVKGIFLLFPKITKDKSKKYGLTSLLSPHPHFRTKSQHLDTLFCARFQMFFLHAIRRSAHHRSNY